MKKNISLITGSGVIGAYLAKELLKRNHQVIVTSRLLRKNYQNYKYLKIQKNVKFVKLNVLNTKDIEYILEKYLPNNIFYFSGQSSITKSIKIPRSTYNSNFIGAKNFLKILKKKKSKTKFLKSNSGYIFKPKNGFISLKSKISENKNPYIQSQVKAYKLLKLYREKKINCYNAIFLQIESPLRDKEFFIKKVCLHAKFKKKIEVGNVNNVRDYSWAPEIVKAVYYLSKLKPRDMILSSGHGIAGKEILKAAYKESSLNYMHYHKINKKFYRKNEVKILTSSKSNHQLLKKRFKIKFNIYGKKLVKKMLNSI